MSFRSARLGRRPSVTARPPQKGSTSRRSLWARQSLRTCGTCQRFPPAHLRGGRSVSVSVGVGDSARACARTTRVLDLVADAIGFIILTAPVPAQFFRITVQSDRKSRGRTGTPRRETREGRYRSGSSVRSLLGPGQLPREERDPAVVMVSVHSVGQGSTSHSPESPEPAQPSFSRPFLASQCRGATPRPLGVAPTRFESGAPARIVAIDQVSLFLDHFSPVCGDLSMEVSGLVARNCRVAKTMIHKELLIWLRLRRARTEAVRDPRASGCG